MPVINAIMRRPCACLLAVSAVLATPVTVAGQGDVFTPKSVNSSTVPANGDLNPYGVAFVPEGFATGGTIGEGDILVGNFNNSDNSQGTGTTVIRQSGSVAPPGEAITFFTSKLPGLSTALGVLRGGFVIVGNVPTTDGTSGLSVPARCR